MDPYKCFSSSSYVLSHKVFLLAYIHCEIWYSEKYTFSKWYHFKLTYLVQKDSNFAYKLLHCGMLHINVVANKKDDCWTSIPFIISLDLFSYRLALWNTLETKFIYVQMSLQIWPYDETESKINKHMLTCTYF